MTDYEALAARFDEDRAAWPYPREALIARGDVVLDLGCGTGRWLVAQNDIDAVTLVGLDPSPAMLAEAAAKRAGHLVLGRGEALPFADATFHVVATNFVFHHFVDKDGALDEITRVLRRGGWFRLDNIEPAAADAHDWWLYRYFPEAVSVDAARFWPTERIVVGLTQRGFAVGHELDAGGSVINAARALADAERRVVSQLAVLDDAAYARGLSRLRADAADDPDRPLPSARSRLSVTARRV